jgi:outer membrane receptor protein involved in Fe transport
VPAHSGTTGKIAGKIVDSQTGEALFAINVLVVGTSLGGATDMEGSYFIINLPPGVYKLKASAVGYASAVAADVRVSADQTTRIDFSLTAQAIEMSGVEVTVSRPIVQKDLTSTVSTVGRDRMAALPVEDVAGLVNLQAGVVEGHFRGGRSGEVKYLVDGMPVNDVFSGASALQPEVNSLEEVQVLSGTFNAEYGEALSGIVNQVTKIAGEKLSGQMSYYSGGYVTGRESLFPNASRVSPLALSNIEGSLGGPVPGTHNTVKFFVSGRFFYDDGYLYGRRVFNPSDSSSFPTNDPATWHVGATGDGAYVPMNFQRRYTLQGKLNVDVGNAKGLVLQAFYQQQDYKTYDHQFVLNPDGDYRRFQKSFLGSVSFNQMFSAATFLDVNASASISDYKQYVFEDPTDRHYVNPERMRDAGGNAFLTGGTQNWHFSHHTNTYTGKLDYTSQLTSIHQVKFGVEVQRHQLQYEDFQVHVDASNGYVPYLPNVGDFDFNKYTNYPYQLAAYAQDKIELDYLVINAGLRFDYFQPDGSTLRDANNIAALDGLHTPYPDSLFRRASVKSQFSPRLGLSYPISDRGAVHLSYGHFFQIPPFEFLYKNPNFRIPLTGTYPEFVGTVLGNADLQPQRTTMYEIGLQQELAENLGITVTTYYKDIRNLLGLEIHIKNDFKKFGEYVNRDYGGVRGVTIAVERRLADGFGANIDYTYQTASGNASDPNDDFNRAQANPPVESNKQFVPLNWDRRHQLNVTLTVGSSGNLVGSLVSRLGSGLPYTPSLQNQRTGLENSDNRPVFFNADLSITKSMTVNALPVSVYVKVYNLFDTANEIDVFGDTGRAGYTLELTRAQEKPRGVNTLEEYFTRPDFYSAPRQVIVGASVSF